MSEILRHFIKARGISYWQNEPTHEQKYKKVKGDMFINPEFIEHISVQKLHVDGILNYVFNVKVESGFNLVVSKELENVFVNEESKP